MPCKLQICSCKEFQEGDVCVCPYFIPTKASLIGKAQKGAEFSPCRKYRYALYRIWNDSKPRVMFIGLNPSTANENDDDPTIRSVCRIAHNLGYGGVYMMNLFAFISTDPKQLKNNLDIIGESNNYWLDKVSKLSQDIIFAWGNFEEAKERGRNISALFPNAMALHVNKNGSPKHPLYCKSDIKPIPFNHP